MLCLLFTTVFTTGIQAQTVYQAKMVEVHDGDTFTLDTFLGKGIWEHSKAHRLFGLDTAELNTPEGIATKVCLQELLPVNEVCYIIIVKNKKGIEQTDKYGRWLCYVFDKNGMNINEFLVRNNLARPYDGGKR